MHELSLCSAIADTVREYSGGRPVARIRLRIGHFRQVVPDTLLFCWGLQAQSSDLGACVLDVDHVPAVILCRDCDHSTTLQVPVFVCGACGNTDVSLVSGEEFLVESIEIDEEIH